MALPIIALVTLLSLPAQASEAPLAPLPKPPSAPFVAGAGVVSLGGMTSFLGFGNAALQVALDGDCVYGTGLDLSRGPCTGPKRGPSVSEFIGLGISGLVISGFGALVLVLEAKQPSATPHKQGLGRDGVFRF
jgi:hypothetical protein